MSGTKRCSRCRRDLPLEDYGVRRASADGLQSYCRECVSDWARAHRPRKLTAIPEVPDGTKWCRRCETAKPLEAFARNRSTVDGRQAHCRACQAEAYRKSREAKGYVVRPAEVPTGHKFCRSCQTIKPLEEWSRNEASSDGLQFRCKTCTSAAGRRDHLHRTYGLSQDEFAALFAAQDGHCAICLIHPAAHVDHDHETGLVRGLLCFSCNAGLGQFAEDPSTLRAAAAYVATYGYRLRARDGRRVS